LPCTSPEKYLCLPVLEPLLYHNTSENFQKEIYIITFFKKSQSILFITLKTSKNIVEDEYRHCGTLFNAQISVILIKCA
jgi:hypothetical protein